MKKICLLLTIIIPTFSLFAQTEHNSEQKIKKSVVTYHYSYADTSKVLEHIEVVVYSKSQWVLSRTSRDTLGVLKMLTICDTTHRMFVVFNIYDNKFHLQNFQRYDGQQTLIEYLTGLMFRKVVHYNEKGKNYLIETFSASGTLDSLTFDTLPTIDSFMYKWNHIKWNMVSSDTMIYDENGRVVKYCEFETNQSPKCYTVQYKGNVKKKTQLTSAEGGAVWLKDIYKYNHQQISEWLCYYKSNGRWMLWQSAQYNSNGDETDSYFWDLEEHSKYEYQYDAQNNWIEKRTYSIYSKKSELQSVDIRKIDYYD